MAVLRSLIGDDAHILRERNFQVLLLANLVGPLGVALLSPLLDSLIDPFGASPASIGLLISAFTGPATLMIPVAGVLADRSSRKRILVVSLLLFGAAGTAIAFTTDFRVALGLRALQGLAYGGLTPVIITSIGDIYSGTTEATAQGLRFTGSGLSVTVFPLLSGLLVGLAWQYPFFIHAIAFPIGLAIWWWFDEPSSDTEDARSDGPTGSYRQALQDLVRNRRVFSLVFARALGSMIWAAFLTFNSIIVVRLIQGTPGQSGLLVAFGSLFFAGSASQAGRLTARFESRLAILIGANAMMLGGFTLVLYAWNLLVAGAGILLVGVGFGTALSLYRSIITHLAPQSLRAGLVGISEAGGRAMDTLTPIFVGGLIAILTPLVGFVGAVRLSGLAAALLGAGGGIVCLLIATRAPTTPVEEFDHTQ